MSNNMLEMSLGGVEYRMPIDEHTTWRDLLSPDEAGKVDAGTHEAIGPSGHPLNIDARVPEAFRPNGDPGERLRLSLRRTEMDELWAGHYAALQKVAFYFVVGEEESIPKYHRMIELLRRYAFTAAGFRNRELMEREIADKKGFREGMDTIAITADSVAFKDFAGFDPDGFGRANDLRSVVAGCSFMGDAKGQAELKGISPDLLPSAIYAPFSEDPSGNVRQTCLFTVRQFNFDLTALAEQDRRHVADETAELTTKLNNESDGGPQIYADFAESLPLVLEEWHHSGPQIRANELLRKIRQTREWITPGIRLALRHFGLPIIKKTMDNGVISHYGLRFGKT